MTAGGWRWRRAIGGVTLLTIAFTSGCWRRRFLSDADFAAACVRAEPPPDSVGAIILQHSAPGIRGRITGSAPTYASVRALLRLDTTAENSSPPVASGKTDSTGAFSFAPVPAGHYWLTAGGYGLVSRAVPVTLLADSGVEIVMPLAADPCFESVDVGKPKPWWQWWFPW
ncbi:MAG: carboxypeptidase-like regulatory domain-containing protein [Gemmatimonadaceae bacterium]